MNAQRLLISLGVLLILVVGATVYAFAVLNLQAGHASLASIMPISSTTTRENHVREITGTIQSLGDHSFLLSVQPHGNKVGIGGEIITVIVTTKTKYVNLKGSATFRALKVGEKVEVRGRFELLDKSRMVATRVQVMQSIGNVIAMNGSTLILKPISDHLQSR